MNCSAGVAGSKLRQRQDKVLYRVEDDETEEHIETVSLSSPPMAGEPPIELQVNGELHRFQIVDSSVRGALDERGRLVFEARVKPVQSTLNQ